MTDVMAAGRSPGGQSGVRSSGGLGATRRLGGQEAGRSPGVSVDGSSAKVETKPNKVDNRVTNQTGKCADLMAGVKEYLTAPIFILWRIFPHY